MDLQSLLAVHGKTIRELFLQCRLFWYSLPGGLVFNPVFSGLARVYGPEVRTLDAKGEEISLWIT